MEKITEEQKQKTLQELNSTEELNVAVDSETGVLTKVTSIAEEEKRTGKEIKVPDAETLVANASADIYRTRKYLVDLFGKMSKKQTIRAVSAIFTLPEGDMPVYLKTDEEKTAFAWAQRHMVARFTVMQKYISDELKKRKTEEELSQSSSTTEEKKDEQ